MQLASGPYFLPKGGLQVRLAQRSSLCWSSELTKSISSGVILPEHSNSRQPLSETTLQQACSMNSNFDFFWIIKLRSDSTSTLQQPSPVSLLNELRFRSKLSFSKLSRSSELTKSISSGVILPEHSNSRQPLSETTLQQACSMNSNFDFFWIIKLRSDSTSTLQQPYPVSLLNELRFRSKFSMSSLGLLLSGSGTDDCPDDGLSDGFDDTHADLSLVCAYSRSRASCSKLYSHQDHQAMSLLLLLMSWLSWWLSWLWWLWWLWW